MTTERPGPDAEELHVDAGEGQPQRADQRQIARWTAAAISRQGAELNCVQASTALVHALSAADVDSRMVTVGAIVQDFEYGRRALCGRVAFDFLVGSPAEAQIPFSTETGSGLDWVDGGHAVVAAPDAGLVLDATFGQFGTRLPVVIAEYEPEEPVWTYQSGEIDFAYLPVDDDVRLDVVGEGAARLLGMDLAEVGAHLGFDLEALVRVQRRLLPPWDLLVAVVERRPGSDQRLGAFRAHREEHLADLGFPWSIADPYLLTRELAGVAA